MIFRALWLGRLPEDPKHLLTRRLAQPQDLLLDLLAYLAGGFHDEYSPPVFDSYRERPVADGFAVINVDFTKAHEIPACANDGGFLISSAR